MLEFIAKYWLQCILTLISGGLGLLCKKIWGLYKAEQERKSNEEHNNIVTEITSALKKETKEVKEEIQSVKTDNTKQQEQINIIREGILDMQGSSFKRFCRMLLQPDHEISLEEMEQCSKEYHTYKQLQGNSNGDLLYNMVKEKAEYNLLEK